MKGEVHIEQGTESYTSDCSTFQNRLIIGGILCGISTNMIHFYGFIKQK